MDDSNSNNLESMSENEKGENGGSFQDSSVYSQMPRFKNPTLVGIDETTTKTFGSAEDSAIHVLKKQFDDQTEFCDATLVIQGKELKAHWCVLVACPYFEALYRSSLTGVRPESLTLTMASKEVIYDVISFLYTGQVKPHPSRILDMIVVADFLQIAPLKSRCFEFLEQVKSVIVNVENCVKLCWVCGFIQDSSLYVEAYTYLSLNLDDTLKQGDLLLMPLDVIVTFITDERHSFIAVSKLFELIIKWVEYDKTERLIFLPKLLYSLKAQLDRSHDGEFLKAIQNHPLVRDCKETSGFLANLKPLAIELKNCLFIQSRDAPNVVYVIENNRWVNLSTDISSYNSSVATNESCLFGRFSTLYGSDRMVEYDFSKDAADPTYKKEWLLHHQGSPWFHVSLGCTDKIFFCTYDNYKLELNSSNETTGTLEELDPPLLRERQMEYCQHIVINNRYVCVIGIIVDSQSDSDRFCKATFSYYDLTKSTVDCLAPDIDLINIIYIYEHKNSLVIGKKGEKHAIVFDFAGKQKCWQSNEMLAVPDCPFGELLVYHRGSNNRGLKLGRVWSLVTVGDSLYGFLNRTTSVSVAQYNILSQQWTHVIQNFSPLGVSNKMPCIVKIPSTKLCCHFECPHCLQKKDLNAGMAMGGLRHDEENNEDVDRREWNGDDDDDDSYSDYTDPDVIFGPDIDLARDGYYSSEDDRYLDYDYN